MSPNIRSSIGVIAGTILAVLVSFALSLCVVYVNHGSPVLAIQSLYSGSFGSANSVGDTLVKAIPMCLVGIGISIAFRARMWNIGGEGQLLVGAITCSAVGLAMYGHAPSGIVIGAEILAGSVAGAIWAGLAGIMRVRFGVTEVITTIMLNFVAAEVVSYLVHGPLQEPTRSLPATASLADQAMLPQLSAASSLHAGIYIAAGLILASAAWLVLTRGGFRLKIVGANETAAQIFGYNVFGIRLGAMIASGAFCGLAGAIEISGVLGRVYESYSPGYGFTGIATALIGRLNPFGIALSSIFFGALYAGSGTMQRDAHVSAGLVNVIQGLILLSLLVGQYVQARRLRSDA